MKNRFILFLIVFLFFNFSYAQQDYFSILDRKEEIESSLEEKIQKTIEKIVGPGKSIVSVNAQINIERMEIQQETATGTQETEVVPKPTQPIVAPVPEGELFLPGLSLSQPSAPKEISVPSRREEEINIRSALQIPQRMITKLYVHILLDENIPLEKINLIATTVSNSLLLDEAQGDELVIETTPFFVGYLDRFFPPAARKYIIWGLLGLLALWIISRILRSLILGIRKRKIPSQIQEANAEIRAEVKPPEEKKEAEGIILGEPVLPYSEEEYRPFSYINENNLKSLLFLIRKEPPEKVALILSYLPPDYQAIIVSAFPPDLRAKIALNLTKIRQWDKKTEEEIDKEIKEKINYVYGGLNKFAQVLVRMSKSDQEEILNSLERIYPDFARELREAIFVFEDIPLLSDYAMQRIVEKINDESLAICLIGASEEIKNKIFKNISEGRRKAVQEAMEYKREITSQQIEEERRKFLETIYSLEGQGKIELPVKIKKLGEELKILEKIEGTTK